MFVGDLHLSIGETFDAAYSVDYHGILVLAGKSLSLPFSLLFDIKVIRGTIRLRTVFVGHSCSLLLLYLFVGHQTHLNIIDEFL